MFRCEVSARKVLPVIRRELALLYSKQGRGTCEIAGILRTSPAAVSQYISGKRGKIKLNRRELAELKKVAEGGAIDQDDICRLCKTITGRLSV